MVPYLAHLVQEYGDFPAESTWTTAVLLSLHDTLPLSSVLYQPTTAKELTKLRTPLLELNGIDKEYAAIDLSHTITIPDSDFVRLQGYTTDYQRKKRGGQEYTTVAAMAKEVDSASKDSPWSTKKNAVVWRGVATGILQVDADTTDGGLNNWRSIPRVQLCMKAKMLGDQLDARLAG